MCYELLRREDKLIFIPVPPISETNELPVFIDDEFRKVRRKTTNTTFDGPPACGKTTSLEQITRLSILLTGGSYIDLYDLYGIRFTGDVFANVVRIVEPGDIFVTQNSEIFAIMPDGRHVKRDLSFLRPPKRTTVRQILFDPTIPNSTKLKKLVEARRSFHQIKLNKPTAFFIDRGALSTIAINTEWDNDEKTILLRNELLECISQHSVSIPTHKKYPDEVFLKAQELYEHYQGLPVESDLEEYFTIASDIPLMDTVYIVIPDQIRDVLDNLLRRGTEGDPFDQNIVKVIEYAARYRILSQTPEIWRRITHNLYRYTPDFDSGIDKANIVTLCIFVETLYRYYCKTPLIIDIGNTKRKLYILPNNLLFYNHLKNYKISRGFRSTISPEHLSIYLITQIKKVNAKYNIPTGHVLFPPELEYGDISVGYEVIEDDKYKIYFTLPINEEE